MVSEASRAPMVHVPRGGVARRAHRLGQCITRDEAGEIGCAPDIATPRRIARALPSRRRRRDERGAQGAPHAGILEIDDPTLAQGHEEGADAGPKRRGRERQRIAREHRDLVLVHLQEVEAGAPRGHFGERAKRAEPRRLHPQRERMQVRVDRSLEVLPNQLRRREVERIVELSEQAIAETLLTTGAARDHFLGVGIGSPGPLDRDKGIVIFTPNLGWRDFPLRDRVQDGLRLPATLDNDANCATLGEWWLGAARGARHVVGLTIGTGIGGGLILDGKLYHGTSDVAGELGHSTIESAGRRCKCGNYGCIEAYASGPAIAERAREALAGGEPSAMPAMVSGDLGRLTAATVYEAAQTGDRLALEVVRETARFLGTGIANLLNIFNPEVVVLAGGVTQAGDALFEPLRAEIRRRAFKPAVDACRIVPGTLQGNAGVIGAVATFAQHQGLM